MNIYSKIALALLLVVSLGAACGELEPIAPTSVNTGSVDFTRFHTVGNSLTAGTQSNSLIETRQIRSFPALLGEAARAPKLEMPLISSPGIPNLLYFSQLVPTPVIDTLQGTGMPTNTAYPGVYNNLGIPGAKVNDLLTKTAADGGMYGIVLRTPTLGNTAVDQAVNAAPTFATVWIGANDIFNSASQGTDALLTPTAAFTTDFISVMDAITAAAVTTVAANIPGMLSIPFFATIPPVVVDPVTREPVLIGGNPVPLIGTSGNLPPDALVTLGAASYLAAGIGIPVIIPGGTGNPLPDFVVLMPTEKNNILTRIDELNTVIDTVCANRSVPVVDVHALLADLSMNGVEIRGELFNTDYVTGGLFSVDGFHPSSMGHWVIATEFARVINVSFAAAIPAPPLPIDPVLNRVPGADDGKPLTPLHYALELPHHALAGFWRAFGVNGTD